MSSSAINTSAVTKKNSRLHDVTTSDEMPATGDCRSRLLEREMGKREGGGGGEENGRRGGGKRGGGGGGEKEEKGRGGIN